MKYLLSVIFCLIFSAKAIGQHDRDLNYDALVSKILGDLPLENFKNEPTFLRVFRARGYCIINEHVKNQEYQTKNSAIRTHFLSAENLARLQGKIKTALIPYFDGQGMESLFLFHGNPIFKRYRGSMPKFETITRGEIQYYDKKQAIGYFPYRDKPVKINVQKGSLWDYVDQTNHIKLEFHQSEADKVFVEGTINHKKVALNYQFVYGVWQQVPQFRASDISHYNHKGQLFIKHNDIIFEYEKLFDLEDVDIVSETDITPVHEEFFLSENLINIDSIIDFNFSDLRNLKFTSENEDKSEKYVFFQFNTELFALISYHKYDGNWFFSEATLYPYSPISIAKNKRIYSLFGEDYGVIIPEKNGIHVYLDKTERFYNFKDFSTEIQQKNYRNYNTETLAHIANDLNFEQFYTIKEVPEGKRMYNYLGIEKLDKAYDSIFVNNFIVGIKDGKYDIYNQTFKKFNLKKVQAVHFDKNNEYNLQIIQNNELKNIPLSGDTSDKYIYINPAPPLHTIPEYITYEINENEILSICELGTSTLKKLKEDFKNIFFLQNKKQKITTEQAPFIVTKDSKNQYSLIHIYNPNKKLLEGVDRIELIVNDVRFKENNKYGYYGIHNKGRFIKLEPFQGFFARFELPNGQKGWLDRNGKEYLDIP